MLDKSLINAISASFKKGKSIRKNIGPGSKLVIDQKLPYLCVYRFQQTPNPYIVSLLHTQGAYLIADTTLNIYPLLDALISIAITDFKTFMIVEVWQDEDTANENTINILHPGAKLTGPVKALDEGFTNFKTFLPVINVERKETLHRHPKNLTSLVTLEKLQETGTLLIGLALPLLLSRQQNATGYPFFFRIMRRKFAETIKKAAFEFVRLQADNEFAHYLSLGKTRINKLVRSADREMAAISENLNFLLMVTPVNATSEWEKFQKNNYSKIPRFTYRLISLDPEIEKRKLFNIKIEKIEHPTLAFLLREKRMELEKQLIMLEERGTKKFLATSKSLFGQIDNSLKETAIQLLNDERPNEQKEIVKVNAWEFAERAEAELSKYREKFPGLKLRVKVKDTVSGLIVSGPELSVGTDLSISNFRIEPLIQHEVGTHILTWCNGHLQPLNLMYAGLAGYEQLQEGLAVLAEFFAGGLTRNRLKLLAARVMAVKALMEGADFIELFNMLHKEYCFTPRTAFYITMRVHRGGGYTKDAIYLKGLVQLIEFIKNDGGIDHLYSGKFALEHLPMIDELIYLNIVKKPILPSYVTSGNAKEKIALLKGGLPLQEMSN